MAEDFDGISLSQPAKYQITIQGREVEGLADWMDELDIRVKPVSRGLTLTLLTGIVRDQAALHGILNRIRDLSIPLLSVELIDPPIIYREDKQDG